jgi:hypothetical protein
MPGMDESSLVTEPVQWAQDIPLMAMVGMVSSCVSDTMAQSTVEGNGRGHWTAGEFCAKVG